MLASKEEWQDAFQLLDDILNYLIKHSKIL
jgi:hypothetical protein